MNIQTLLVANRGEIALRVFRTCEAHGIRTAAVYTDADASAPHVRAADVAVRVPSYLDSDAVVAAAEEAGADAIHPGYGFLSENAGFARAVGAAGITWVGPTPEVIERMGRKDAAREIAVAAGVPVVPQGDPTALPLLVKAAAGGGGKGMRIVRSADELDDAIAAAKRESLAAFGDDTMLIEKYVERGRHIEVQVLGDTHGNVIHLLTRECSVQRRHQKVIEEAPAPRLPGDVRERIHAAAVELARAVGYTNAGTVEFLLDADTDDFYFLEMNTRLQVEHPVTEEVTGVDLVEAQLHVAVGDALRYRQEDILPAGHAIEARIYAEDPYAGFLPQAGRASLVQWPEAATVVDHDLVSGQVVSTAFDPMLGKVVVHGDDRETARLALVRALDDTVILGLTTNTGFLRELVASDEFARPGTIDTAWLDRNEPTAPDPTHARELAAHAWQRAHAPTAGPFAADGFRIAGPPAPVQVDFEDGSVVLGEPPAELPVSLVTSHRVELAHHGQRYVFERPDAAADHGVEAGDGTVVAPMPGTVLDVRVAEGASVSAGDVLGVVEAMKMELALKAPYDGVVTAVAAVAGAQVALGDALFVVEEK